jgi:hypothetical protein
MAMMTIQDPGLASGFQALAQAFTGNPSAVIDADVKRRQASTYDAEAALDNAKAQAQTAQSASLQRLQQAMTDPGWVSDPAKRAVVAAYMAGAPEGLQYGPRAALGFGTYVNPDALTPEQLSAAESGAGYDYANTPTGLQQKFQTALSQNAQDNATKAGIAIYGRGPGRCRRSSYRHPEGYG